MAAFWISSEGSGLLIHFRTEDLSLGVTCSIVLPIFPIIYMEKEQKENEDTKGTARVSGEMLPR